MVTSVHKRGFDCQVYQVNMAATTSETNSSRYPSEKSVKEALDMLKPPGILSKVGFTTFCNIIEHYCHFIQRILSIRILQIIARASASNRCCCFYLLGLQPVSAQTIPGMFFLFFALSLLAVFHALVMLNNTFCLVMFRFQSQ